MNDHLPPIVDIVEVGPRDGWQMESTILPTEVKIEIIRRLATAGVRRIQVTSFVHPRLVPQMADAEAVCAGLERRPEITYSGLVLNMKGLERAVVAGLDQVDIGVSASDTHSRKNANKSREAALAEFAEMIHAAQTARIRVRAGIQCAFGCVYEGQVPQSTVVDMIKYYLDLGLEELALSDSTGMANPVQITRMIEALRPLIGERSLTLHLHDTRGMGLANLAAALQMGVTRFDTAFGGLGGCPFIKGAAGNIATEDTLYMLAEMGIDTGIDLGQIASISRELEELLGKKLPGKLYCLV